MRLSCDPRENMLRFSSSGYLTTLYAFIVCTMAADPAHSQAHSELLLGDPSLATCPTANCPAPPQLPVLATQVIHGNTTKGPQQAEWLSTIGLFVRTGNPDGQKVAQYIGVMQQTGAGTAWALNTDLVRNAGPGARNSFAGLEGSGKSGEPGSIGDKNGSIGYELDFTNWDADSRPGVGAFTVGQYIHAQSTFTSLAAIYFDAAMAESNRRAAWADGLLFNGDRVISDNTIFDGTRATNSLTISGNHLTGVNTSSANPNLNALVMREGQTICLNRLQNCVTYTAGKLLYKNKDGKVVFSVDDDGNAFFAGHVFSK